MSEYKMKYPAFRNDVILDETMDKLIDLRPIPFPTNAFMPVKPIPPLPEVELNEKYYL